MPKDKDINSDEKPVMDVNKPEKKATNASSRPIIVSRKTIVEDSTVKDADKVAVPGAPAVDAKDERLKKLMGKRTTKINITPEGEIKQDTNDEAKPEETPEKSEEKPSNREKETTVAEDEPPDKQNEPEKSGDEKTSEANVEETSGAKVDETDPIVDELAKQALGKRQKEAEEKEEQSRAEKIDKLVESKKYVLPVGQVTRRRNNQRMFLVLLLVILLTLVTLNFLMDADIVHLGIKPLTNLL